MKKLYLFVLLFLVHFISLAQPSDKLELLDIFELEYVSDPQISPDGNKIVYVRNFKDIMTDKNFSNLWIVNFDGSNNRPLTSGNQNDFAPKWSNDGKKIVYKSAKDGSVQIYLKWIDTNDEARLTNIQYSPGSISWSPDDKYLAFNMFVPGESSSPIQLPSKPKGAKWNDAPKYIDKLNYRADGRGYLKNGYQQLFVLSANGGTPRQITNSKHNYSAPVWPKNSETLYFSANLKDNSEYEPLNSEIYKISIQSGKIDTLTHRFGPDTEPKISPDGKYIAYLGFDDVFEGYQITNLYVMDVNGNNPKNISGNFDRDIENIYWNEKSNGLFFQYDENGNTWIAHIDLKGNVKNLTKNVGGLSLGRPYTGGTFSITPKGKYAFTLSTPEHPADLASGQNTLSKRITNYNEDLFKYKNLGKTEEIWFNSSFDGRKVQGWVVTPPNFDSTKKYPLILEIHGGPFLNYGARFSAEIQLYAASGYVVLYVNPRGSTSYGKDFGNLIHHNYPGQDYDDLMSGVDAVISKGFIDENNLFVTGGSGGGVLSAWIVGKTNRFKAAVVAKPVINFYSFALYADFPSYFYKYWFADYPWNDFENYYKRSPISLAGNVTTPTMILTGEDDYRTPIAESEQFYTALKLRKVDAALVRIPNASHGIAANPSNLIAKVSAILSWFNKYKTEKTE
ncbi:S9 family peptidase [Abyssalbus ytuae]|uniref:S9 family peptidase n=1 Tax=Abyssalbus ytuae TaxID=2926907 RepID=A0A9E6ZWM1_9FLAO|nr:S9 family peptidase [Abyssalbus ytuae]UOB16552.1 S9 family peptidase [Abyssalbus ytuae]